MHKLNLEIWREIIACLAYPQDQQTLRALALTSRRLSVLALNTIWEDGKRLPRIISVINSFAPPPNGPFLEYVRGEWDDEDEDDEEEEEKDENNDSEDGTEEITPFSREPGNWVSSTAHFTDYLTTQLMATRDSTRSSFTPYPPLLAYVHPNIWHGLGSSRYPDINKQAS